MKDIAYYNGTIGRIDEVKAPITDRGFYFGDGVYDVTMVKNHKLFAMDDHLDRFYSSLSLLRIEPPMERGELEALLRDLVSRLDSDEPYNILYWQATRASAHRTHVFPKGVRANLMAYAEPCTLDPVNKPLRLLSMELPRFFHCNIKTLNLIPNCMALEKAAEQGCGEVVYHRGDRVTEGAHSGLAILKDGVFCTPPVDELILPSVTRKHFLELCEQLGIPSRVAPFSLEDVRNADEVLILSTGSHGVSACELDGQPIGGKAPELLHRLQAAYQAKFEAETAK